MDFLPVNKQDLISRNIDALDFIMVSGDAYIDHHSFGASLVARLFESLGFTVGMIAQPQNDSDYKRLGTPKHGFLLSSGVVDSMVSNYTVAKIKRKEDEYSPKGKNLKVDRVTDTYSKNLKRIFPDSFIIGGGIEPSLRRFSHYDYWSDKVLPSILESSSCDLIIYGMGERPIFDICSSLNKGIPLNKIRDIRGTCYIDYKENLSGKITKAISGENNDYLVIDSHEKVCSDKTAFANSFRIQSQNTDSITGACILQQVGDRYVVQNKPAIPLSEKEMDYVYSLNFMRDYHPMYEKFGGVMALDEVKFSITSHRGCFGSCSFCALTYHQGRVIQKRSENSIVEEAKIITQMPDFKGYIHDVGGPSANFRDVACDKQIKSGVCKDKYCIGSKRCPNLKVNHRDYLKVLRAVRKVDGIKKVFIRSGIRFDYLMADKDKTFFNELVKYHVSGQLKVAPEHIANGPLEAMNKPQHEIYKNFCGEFDRITKDCNLNQYIVPYFISSHPGCTLNDAIKLAQYLKSINYMPLQVQDFYPTPSTRATCMYYTGIDPITMKKVFVAKTKEEKQLQRALLQYRKKENYHHVLKALKLAGREDLIGYGENCLIKPLDKMNYTKTAKPNQNTKTYGNNRGNNRNNSNNNKNASSRNKKRR